MLRRKHTRAGRVRAKSATSGSDDMWHIGSAKYLLYGGTAVIFSPLFLPGTPGYCTAFLIRVIILERCGLCALNLLFVYSPIRAGRLQPGPLVKTGGKR